MFRIFLGCLAVAAIGLMISQAVAGGNGHANIPSNSNGVLIIETISSSSMVEPSGDENMQPLPGSSGVDVAPIPEGSSAVQPVLVEEGMMVEQTESE